MRKRNLYRYQSFRRSQKELAKEPPAVEALKEPEPEPEPEVEAEVELEDEEPEAEEPERGSYNLKFGEDLED